MALANDRPLPRPFAHDLHQSRSYAPYSAMLRFTIASRSASSVVESSTARRAFPFSRLARAASLSTVRFLGIHTSNALNAPGTIKPHLFNLMSKTGLKADLATNAI